MSDTCRRCGAPVEMRPEWRKAPNLCDRCRPRQATPYEPGNLAAMVHGACSKRLMAEFIADFRVAMREAMEERAAAQSRGLTLEVRRPARARPQDGLDLAGGQPPAHGAGTERLDGPKRRAPDQASGCLGSRKPPLRRSLAAYSCRAVNSDGGGQCIVMHGRGLHIYAAGGAAEVASDPGGGDAPMPNRRVERSVAVGGGAVCTHHGFCDRKCLVRLRLLAGR